jgi:exodeoxyribonuclease VII large subunit
VPDGLEVQPFKRWLPEEFDLDDELCSANDKPSEQGIRLSQLLQQVSSAVHSITPASQWVRAEISEVQVHAATNHCYLELVELQNNKLLCKTKAIIIKNDYQNLIKKFQQITGGDLKPGMQILFLANLSFNIQYGFSLYIKDLDPAYTVGDLAAKLAALRERLQKEQLYQKNKQLPMPDDFTKVAVLSPGAAAGLGDFQREASLLQKQQLCAFHYYTAQFQGSDASREITTALEQIFLDHQEEQFDAVVIIRGGGAVIDLAWLNDYAIAKMVCESPLIVFAGIGHQRDNTIIDEIAGSRFDTPSKVIAQIFHVIVSNAKQALADATLIKHRAENIFINYFNNTKDCFDKTLTAAKVAIIKAEQSITQKHASVLSNAGNIIRITVTTVEQDYARIIEISKSSIKHVEFVMREYLQNITARAPQICLTTANELVALWTNIATTMHNQHRIYQDSCSNLQQDLISTAKNLHHHMEQKIKNLILNVVSLGPKATLERGYAIIKSYDQIINSKQSASRHSELRIEFHDGILEVNNLIK